jgi:hypothetical protein
MGEGLQSLTRQVFSFNVSLKLTFCNLSESRGDLCPNGLVGMMHKP